MLPRLRRISVNTAPTSPLSRTTTLHYLSLSVTPYAGDSAAVP